MASAFPAAAEIPWQVDRNLAGKISTCTTKVVLLCPKLAKKNTSQQIQSCFLSQSSADKDGQCKHEDSHEEKSNQLNCETANVIN